ncbi:hypothetical protein IMY05_011G0070300 [Salix suchowensis]|nr:hypothetical protein IMY05_011G0070300 [Salix suchowensis]
MPEIQARGKEQLGAVDPLLSAETAPLAVPPLLSPSKPKAKEHGGCDGVTVVPTKGKEKIGVVVQPIQLSAVAGGRNGCSPSSHTKEMDGSVFISSPANDVGNNGPKDSDKLGNMAAKSAPVAAKVVSAAEKILVKRWVPIKKVIPDQVKPIEQQSSDEPSRPLTHEEASRPTGCEEQSRPNDVQVSSSLNESLDAQRIDPMQMETDTGEWTVVKRRNGKPKVANDNAVVVTSCGDPVCSVGIDVDPLCGATTRSGIRRSDVLPRSKGLKALAPVHLC